MDMFGSHVTAGTDAAGGNTFYSCGASHTGHGEYEYLSLMRVLSKAEIYPSSILSRRREFGP